MQITKTIKEDDPNVNYENMYFEVLYDKPTNQIMHFLYKREALGPLPRID